MATSIKVRFSLTGRDFDPDEVTRMVGVTPTKTWRRGEQRAGSDLEWEHDGWLLSIPEETSLDVAPQIAKLLGLLRDHVKSISLARETFKLDAEVGVSIYLENSEPPSAHFALDTLKTLCELHADVDIDIYC